MSKWIALSSEQLGGDLLHELTNAQYRLFVGMLVFTAESETPGAMPYTDLFGLVMKLEPHTQQLSLAEFLAVGNRLGILRGPEHGEIFIPAFVKRLPLEVEPL